MGGVIGSQYERADEASAAIKFRRALALVFMTLLLPGSAQIAAGNKKVGRIALRIVLGIFVTALLLFALGFFWKGALFAILTNNFILGIVRWALLILAGFWVYLLIDAWRLCAPMQLERKHRLTLTGINLVLVSVTVAIALFASNVVAIQRDFMVSVFSSGTSVEPTDGRYNILLLGGDSGKGRVGMRPDAIIVASIDEDTGAVVLVSLPRNMHNFKFPDGTVMAKEWPNGFDCDECLLNAVNTWAEDHKKLFDVEEPGVVATKQAVSSITGLEIHYYAMVNMNGFKKLVDSVGGVEVDVKKRVAIGGGTHPIVGYIKPGKQVLDGREALWFARSRAESSDYDRMARQKCLLAAMVRQLNPQTVLPNVKKISESGKDMLDTDIPAKDLNVFLEIALKSRNQQLSTVSLVPPAIVTWNPDFNKTKAMVNQGIENSKAAVIAKEEAKDDKGESSTKQAKATKSTVKVKKGEEANNSDDLDAVC